jgi:flagellar basal-body rod protein FlgF
MIYGLYLSATGILANSYNVDVLANNLANSETVGFKRDLTLFRQRLTQAQQSNHAGDWSDPILEKMGGGLSVNPSVIDTQQGELEATGNPLDLGIDGKGYFAVKDANGTHLTRDGRLMVDGNGNLIMTNSRGSKVLDDQQRPIVLNPGAVASVGTDGSISQNGTTVGKVGLFDVPEPGKLTKNGSDELNYPEMAQIRAGTGQIRSQNVERANVDPTTELAELIEAQRQLEANANMIHYQDETLQSLVQDVGKIS